MLRRSFLAVFGILPLFGKKEQSPYQTFKKGHKTFYVKNGIVFKEEYSSLKGKPHHYTAFYNEEGRLHRDDGPAHEQSNAKYWYKNGKLHRENGPAIEYADGSKCWYKDGKTQEVES